jgi:hypothetical protein
MQIALILIDKRCIFVNLIIGKFLLKGLFIMKKVSRKSLSVILALMLLMMSINMGVGIQHIGNWGVGDPNYRSVQNPDLTIGSFVYEYSVMDYGADKYGK